MKKLVVICTIVTICWLLLGGRAVYGFDTIDHPDSLLSISDAKAFFDSLHVESENWYMAASADSGTWENHYQMGYSGEDSLKPWVPSTARRVIAYIQVAHVDGDNRDIYLDRTYQGLQYLVSEQKNDGRFERECDALAPQGPGEGDDTVQSSLDDIYDTALGGVALVAGYREFGTATYLNSAEDAADWTIQAGAIDDNTYNDNADTNWANETPLDGVSFFANANYVAFIAWLLASVYEETGTSTYIDHAITACDSIMDWQLGDGTWYHYLGSSPDDDKRMVYHCITLRGLLETYWAIKGDPDYASFQTELEGSITDAINYMIDQQRPPSDWKLMEYKDDTTKVWVSGLEALSMAHDYIDDGADLNGLIFALAQHTRSYNYKGSGSNPVYKAAEARHHDILNFGWYLHSTIWGKIYPGEVWSGTIRPTGDVIVSSGDSLKIDPGTTVIFPVNKDSYHGVQYTSKSELIVYGKLTAEGTAQSPIILQSTEGGTTKQQWRGIVFWNSADDASAVKYCNIKNAIYGVHLDRAVPDITYNHISYSSYGIRAWGTAGDPLRGVTIQHNTLDYNGYGLHLGRASTGDVEYNSACNNTVRGMYFYQASPLDISHNTVSNNPNGIEMSGGSPSMSSNTVKDNTGWGAYFYSNADPTLLSSKIGDNGSHGIRMYNDSDPVLNYYSSADNAIQANGTYELHIKLNSDPSLDYGHNDIVASAGGWHVYIDTTVSYSSVNARRNWWGETDSTTFDFCPRDNVVFVPYDSTENTGGVGKIIASVEPPASLVSDAYSLLFEAIHLQKQGQYHQAASIYRDVIDRYPDSRAAEPALSGLLSVNRGVGEDLAALCSYFENLTSSYPGTDLARKARWLSIDCLELSGDPQSAVAQYRQMSLEPGEIGLAAALRMGEIYLSGLRDTAQARKVFEQIISDAPESEAAFLASDHLAELNHLPRAEPEPRPEPEVAKVSEQSPGVVSLSSNYPNPFNPQTVVCFTLPRPAFVNLEIYNILGQRVRSLTDGFRQAGTYSVSWAGRDENGREVGSGVYLYRLVVDRGRFVQAKKMLLIK